MNKAKPSINMQLRLIFTIFSCLFLLGAQAQVYNQDFSTDNTCNQIDTIRPSANTASWRIYLGSGGNSLDTTNRWYISAREANIGEGLCGDGCTNSSSNNERTLHISTSADPKAQYQKDSITDLFVYAPNFSSLASGSTDMRIEFDYLEGGDTNDNATFVINVGAGFTSPSYTYELEKSAANGCGTGKARWIHKVIYLPAALNNQAQIGFGWRWVSNGDGNGTNPSFAVDNIEVFESDPLSIILASDTSICQGGSISFSDSSQGNPSAWAWDFGSTQTPSTSNSQNPGAVIFPNIGTYIVTLTTTNTNGTHDTTVNITVLNCVPPTPDFTVQDDDFDICQGQCIDFLDLSIPGTYGKGQWLWEFGTSQSPPTSTDQNPQDVCYPNTGVYNVTLTVTDTISGFDSVIVFQGAITVGECEVPAAAFDMDTNKICNNDFIEFYNLSTGEPDKLKWEFGANANPTLLEDFTDLVDTIQVFFPVPGIYTVTLTAWNGAGIDDTIGIFQTIEVIECVQPLPDFTASKRKICPGTIVVFEDLSGGPPTAWEWEFPGGIPSASVDQNPEVRYDSAGIYPVLLTVKNVNGDSSITEIAFITVDSCLPPLPRFEIESDSICRGSCVQFFNTSLRADSIFWIFWWHPYPDSLDTIIARTLGGDTTDTFYIAEDYFPMFINDSGIVDTIFMEQDPIYCFNDSGVVGVQLFAFNEYDVAIENKQDVAVLSIGGAYPELKSGPDKYVRIDNINSRFYLEDTAKFDPVGTGQFFRWFPDEGLSCYDCPDPIIYPTETRKYFITNYDEYNCQVYDSVIVFVQNNYYVGIPNIFSPNGDNNNDVLWVRGNGIADDGYVMRVWNRYGEKIFESYTQNEGWDGNFKGTPAAMGAYTYYVKVTFLDGTVKELSGNVTLVRH
jgi:gliding motility-associated-like protein